MAQRHIARCAVGPESVDAQERTVTTLAVNCQQTQNKRQNKAKANREQLLVDEVDTTTVPRCASKPSLTNYTAGESSRRGMHEPQRSVTWPSLHLTRRSIFTPRRHLMPCKPTARGKRNNCDRSYSDLKYTAWRTQQRKSQTHREWIDTKRTWGPQKAKTQIPRMKPPRHDRPSSRLRTPIKTYRTHEIADHPTRRTGTPRHDGAVFLHCKTHHGAQDLHVT